MGSRKEEERNEKIIRGLLKLPPNRRCINCDSLGPQYVCTNFWTFVCISCSGIHREFTHRVKSVSMAKFTAQEVDALQRGGNQRAREIFLKDWDTQRTRLPDNSNVDKIREFIRSVYVDKKYAVERSSDKPPRDTQSPKDPGDYRRASSYHSFSQSPPYDHQYEDRRYGKQTGMLTRKPGSYHGNSEGKISSFMFSPGHQVEQLYEDRFANEGSGSRISDYSLSSRSDPFKSDGQSPNFQDAGYINPPSQQLRDILIEDAQPQILKTFPEANVKKDFDGIPCSQRAASSSSFGSPDGNSATNLGSLLDIGLEPEHPSGTQQGGKSALFSSQISASAHSKNLDLFSLPEVRQSTTSIAPSVDLFEGINHQAPFTDPLQQKELADPISENAGWATFDLPHYSESSSKTINGLTSMVPSDVAAHTSATSTMYNNSEWFSVQNSATQGHFPSTNNSLHVDFVSDDTKNSQGFIPSTQPWNAFNDFTGNVSRTSVGALPQNHEAKVEVHKLTSGESYINFEVPEAPIDCGFQKSADVATLGFNLPFTGVTGSSFSASVLPMTEGTTREQKSTNPFDLPFDADQEDNNVFPDMSSLQEGLENPQFPFPTSFFGDLSQPWFPQNPITTFIPSLPQGELIYTAEQVPSSQLQNVPPQNSVASLGNPFA